ncbi:hypothetical protein Taro_045861 [Colocasia esculenta]|uniref:Uncharacterized protein n=1 Tax=Colocasia esculenta TaxID=4460 RepID=A0A843WSB5_COLES|nr:hypothetical protein [Colocasia esculenta]
MVAVSLNDIRVDANLCDLQNIGLPEDGFLSSFSLSLALFSCPLLPHYFQELYKGWEYLRYQPRVSVKLMAEDLSVNIDCRQVVSSGLCPGTCVVPSRSVSSDLDTLTPINLKWLIDEIGVVEEMIQRRVLSVKEEDGEVDNNFSKVVVGQRIFLEFFTEVGFYLICFLEAMWTFMVAVSLNGIRVDANLCELQNIGLPEDNFLSSFSLSLALFSCPLLPHYFQELYKGWEYLRYQPRVSVKLMAEDLSVNIDCRQSADVLGEFPTEPVTSKAHPYPPQVRARRMFLNLRPVQSRVVAVQGQYLQQCSLSSAV